LYLSQSDYIGWIVERLSMHLAWSATTSLPAKPSVVTKGLPDTRSGGGPYEVDTICIDCWLIDIRYGRDATKHSLCGWSRQQIHAQSQPPTLERSETYLQLSSWHTRLGHQIRTERTLRLSRLHQLRLRGLSWHSEIDVRILLHIRIWRHFMEVETTRLYGHEYDRSGVCSCVWCSEGSALARTSSLYISTS
jgi:hypothetical protein